MRYVRCAAFAGAFLSLSACAPKFNFTPSQISSGAFAPTSYQLVFTTQPSSSAMAGSSLPTGGVIEVQDNHGNLITSGALASATIALADSTKNGAIVGATSVTLSGGIGTIPNNTVVFEKGGTKSIAATTTVSGYGTITGQSASINVTVPAVSTVAQFSGPDDPSGDVDGTGTAARLYYPSAMTSDGTYLYFIEAEGNGAVAPCVIRKYDIATGAVSSFAGQLYDCNSVNGGPGVGSIGFNGWNESITTDGTYVYWTANATIQRADIATQTIQYMAGGYPTGLVNSTNGSSARFAFGSGSDRNILWINGTNLYVADNGNCVIRVIDLTNSNFPVSTYAGNGTCASADESAGTPLTAEFNGPSALYGDSNYLYVLDASGIRRVDWSTGNVDTLETATTVNDFTISGSDIYAVNGTYSILFDLLVSTGAYVQDLAGQAWNAGEVDGALGTSLISQAQYLYGLGTNVYFADVGNDTLRVLNTSTNDVTTIAGTANAGMGETDGLASAASYSWPGGAVSDGIYLYTLESPHCGIIVRQVALADGSVTTHGSGWSWPGCEQIFGESLLGKTLYITSNTDNKVYAVDTTTWTRTVLAGTGASGDVDSTFLSSEFADLGQIATDGQSLYVTDDGSIKKLDLATSTVTLLSGLPGTISCATGSASASRYQGSGMTGSLIYMNGELYMTSTCSGGAIIQIDPNTGYSSVYAGNGTAGYVNGTLANAEFSDCGWGCTLTTDGIDLYLMDGGNGTVRKIDASADSVTTLWGDPTQRWQVDGTIGGTAREGDADSSQSTLYYGFGKFYVVHSRGIRVAQ